MNIALVGPSPVPFTMGGVERVLMALTLSINRYTDHIAELIKLPSRERSFWELLDTYETFLNLNLDHFDAIVSTKYPAWMVRHATHICYMHHRLRGLYDTYGGMYDVSAESEQVRRIMDLMEDDAAGTDDTRRMLHLLRTLRYAGGSSCDDDLYVFPGPFIRRIVHYLDDQALRPDRIRKFFSISNTVKSRTEYFPSGCPVTVLYLPSFLPHFKEGDYEYVFTVSRLDAPKRVHLLINAMRFVRHDVKLLIAGTGPQADYLRELAGDDDRIQFLGFVNDDRLVDLYANALVVPYVPYEEDLGLVTIEAMMSRKPVLTTSDSGGPTEFVRDGRTGYVVDPTPERLAEKIDYFADNKEQAYDMGNRAYGSVKDISWERTVNRLLGGVEHSPSGSVVPGYGRVRRRIVVLSTYSFASPRGGGQHRMYHHYRNLSRYHDVSVLCLVPYGTPSTDRTVCDGLLEICVPQTRRHVEMQWAMEKEAQLDALHDISMIEHARLTPDFAKRYRELQVTSDIVIVSHPYLFGLVPEETGELVIYEAVDIEYAVKKGYLARSPRADRLTRLVKECEEMACRKSDLVFATSEEDRDVLGELYGVPLEKVHVIPNGVDTAQIEFTRYEERGAAKRSVGLERPTILFVGSWHPPNLEALEFIIDELAPQNDECIFLVVGSVKDYYIRAHDDTSIPQNVLLLGVVEEEEKEEIYRIADIAINPMFSGAGTNLKMLDYLASGIPVISTAFGARGLSAGETVCICERSAFSECIAELLGDSEACVQLAKRGRELVEEQHDWRKIAERTHQVIRLQET